MAPALSCAEVGVVSIACGGGPLLELVLLTPSIGPELCALLGWAALCSGIVLVKDPSWDMTEIIDDSRGDEAANTIRQDSAS